MGTVLQILQLVMGTIPQLIELGQQAVAAHQSNDQAELDALLAKAQAASNALAPDQAASG